MINHGGHFYALNWWKSKIEQRIFSLRNHFLVNCHKPIHGMQEFNANLVPLSLSYDLTTGVVVFDLMQVLLNKMNNPFGSKSRQRHRS